MAIDTDNKKLAIMEWGNYWEPGLPLLPGAIFDQGEKQQLLWGYPGILWTEGAILLAVCQIIDIVELDTTENIIKLNTTLNIIELDTIVNIVCD